MKISRLNVQNFLGIHAVKVKLNKPITLFAGKNGVGKSSLQEAVRMALTGEAVRVNLKKDYNQLVTKGAETGFSEVEIDHTIHAFVTLPDGTTTPATEYVPPQALPYVLDAQRFARLEPNQRRAFLFGLMGLSANSAEVHKRLLAKGCDERKIEIILPLLRAGFEATHEEAQAKAREEKIVWRTLTGETYGNKKAVTWTAEKPTFDSKALNDLQQKLIETDVELTAAHQQMGALQSNQKRHAEAAQRLVELRQKSSRYDRIVAKLGRDEAELKEWDAKVNKLNLLNLSQKTMPCPNCDAMLVLKDDVLAHASPPANSAQDDLTRLPEYEKARHLLQTAVDNGKRDLADADAASKAISEWEVIVGVAPDETEIHTTRKSVEDLKATRSAIAAKLIAHQDAERQAKRADEQTTKAQATHESILAWSALAEALAPDGIPGEMLAEALTPLNRRLEASAEVAEWATVVVRRDMQVSVGNSPYSLLSESEKWRADAMLSEAITHLSKIKLLVLDRFDVLDLEGRADLIAWLDILVKNGEIDTALIFGTLKTLPATLPETIAAYWLENGVVAQTKKAA